MRSHSYSRLVSTIYDAAVEPRLWPAALQSVAEAFGAVGAAYVVQDKRTDRVGWISVSGPCVQLKADYVSYYSTRDPYRPILGAAPSGRWLRLSSSLPKTVLRGNEWYNDFVVKSGVGDILAARLFEHGSYTARFGIHQGIKQARLTPARSLPLPALFEALSRAAQLHYEFRRLSQRSSIALRALDQVATGVIVTDCEARVIDINRAAERAITSGDGLMVRHGRLCTRRVFETAKLAKLIAAAAARDEAAPRAGRMLIGRRDGGPAYVLTVTPLGAELAASDYAVAMVLVADPEQPSPSEKELAEFFGFSPAESRLAAALMTGMRLRDIATGCDVRITTLRTQLSSILRKAGVKRQADLVRVLASTRLVASDASS